MSTPDIEPKKAEKKKAKRPTEIIRELKKRTESDEKSRREGKGNWVGEDRDGENRENLENRENREDRKEGEIAEQKLSASAFVKRRKLDLPTKSNLVKAKTIPAPHERNRPWALEASQRARAFRQENGFGNFLAVPKYRMPGYSIDGKHSGGQHN